MIRFAVVGVHRTTGEAHTLGVYEDSKLAHQQRAFGEAEIPSHRYVVVPYETNYAEHEGEATEPPKTPQKGTQSHTHEAWQLQQGPEGTYCAACGVKVTGKSRGQITLGGTTYDVTEDYYGTGDPTYTLHGPKSDFILRGFTNRENLYEVISWPNGHAKRIRGNRVLVRWDEDGQLEITDGKKR